MSGVKAIHSLLVAFLVGFASLAAQFAFNRLIFFYLANSELAAASVISLHLLGFLVGSLIGKRLLGVRLSIILSASLLVTVCAYIFSWQMGVVSFGISLTLIMTAGLSLLNALLAGWCMIHLIYQKSEDESAAGQVVIADSTGSVGGAAITGMLIMPIWGIEASLAVIAMLQLSALAIWYGRHRPHHTWQLAAVLLCAPTACIGLIYLMTERLENLAAPAQKNLMVMVPNDAKELYRKQSAYGLVSAYEYPSESGSIRAVKIDNYGMCGLQLPSSPSRLQQMSEWTIGDYAARWVSHQATGARLANVGLGCGTTLAAMLKGGEGRQTVETIEINPIMTETAEFFTPELGIDLDDPRHMLTINDGFRHFAERQGKKPYDAVVMHVAWTMNMNATHLYSKEMFENVKAAMNEDGLFVVWIDEYGQPFSRVSQIIYQTLLSVFPIVRVQQEPDTAIAFYATFTSEERKLIDMLDPLSLHLTGWLVSASAEAPINTLNNLTMNRARFKWFSHGNM